jgi:ribonuclease D
VSSALEKVGSEFHVASHSTNAQNRANHHGRQSEISAPVLVQTKQEFHKMLTHLANQPLLAVDTESDSLFRYTPRVCLIQISAPAAEGKSQGDGMVDYLVDPLSLHSLDALGELMAQPEVEVIMHAAENDILILQRDFGFTLNNLFDTQLAARILGRQGVGLARMLEEEFGVISDKRMQRTDWGRRPLTPQQMTYAQIDTHYLSELRQRQIESLQAVSRWEEAQEAFLMLELVQYEEGDGRSVWTMKGTKELALNQMGMLEELWLWREKTAERMDRPPFKVLQDHVLVALTNRKPRQLSELANIPGLSKHAADRYGPELLRAVERGHDRSIPRPPEPKPRPEQHLTDQEQDLYHVLRQWRSEMAQRRGTDPDLVFTNDLLVQLIELKPQRIEEFTQITGIGPWKAKTYGPMLIELIRQYTPQAG